MTKRLTEGSPIGLIVRFALPLLIGNAFQQLYNTIDTLIVGRTLGVSALAAVGCTGPLIWLTIGFTNGATYGMSIVTAQRFGAGDDEGTCRSFATSIVLSGLFTLLFTVAGVPLSRLLLQLLNTPVSIIDAAHEYLVIMMAGMAAAMLFNLMSNLLRAVGDSKTPLVFLAVACGVNVVLDIVLIRVVGMGVAGAAVATVAAQLCAGLLCIVFVAKKMPMLHIKRRHWVFTKQEFWQHFRIGAPMGFQSSVITLGTIAVQFSLNSLGENAVAAFTSAEKIEMFAMMPLMSFGMTMATYTAQNYGAGLIDRIRKGVRQCMALSLTFSVAAGLAGILFGKQLVSVFVGQNEAVLELAHTYLIVDGCGYWALALLFIFRYTLQGLGMSLSPTISGIVELCMRTGAALVLVNYLGFAGVCMANPLAWLGSAAVLVSTAVLTFRRLPAVLQREQLHYQQNVEGDSAPPQQ